MATILYIEDEPSLLEMTIEALKEAGHQAFGATNGNEGMKFIKSFTPDIIICDIDMPEMNGHELLSELRLNYPEFAHIPFIFLSAYTGHNDLVKGLNMGADDYIGKPVDFEFLLTKIKSSLRLSQEYEQRISKHDRIDDVTQLPNRSCAMEHLSDCITAAREMNENLSIIVTGIQEHDKLSGTAGIEQGAEFLNQVARRLNDFANENNHVFYLGDGDFLTIHLGQEEMTGDTARQVLDAFSNPVIVGDAEAYPVVKIGQACFPDEGTSVQSLIRNAYSAKSAATKNRGSSFCCYSVQISDHENARLDTERQIYSALEAGEFFLNYQPIIDAETERPVAVEVLLRWHNKVLGNISPNVFIPIAENTGLIDDIFLWVLRSACRQQVEWQTHTGLQIRISVNVSPVQLDNVGFADAVLDVLEETGMLPSCLNLELTEEFLLENAAKTRRIFNELSEKGIGFSVDDFGTGYSSFSYLNNLPFNILKIDREFIPGALESSQKSALVIMMIELAHGLGLKVTAEGVETGEQLAFLRQHKCDFIQGYYYARPMMAEAYGEYLVKQLKICQVA